MTMSNRYLAIVVCLLFTGCATAPDPAEVCTANWIKPRVDAAMQDFRNNSDDILESLQKTGEKVAKSNGELGLLQRGSIILSMARLVNSFQNGQTIKDLNTLSETCNDPDLVMQAFNGLLAEYDVPEPLLNLLTEVEAFRQLINNQGKLAE